MANATSDLAQESMLT